MLQAFVDIVFPPRSTELIIRKARSSEFIQLSSPRQYRNHQFLLSYSHEHIHAAIIENKFHYNTRATKLLAATLSTWNKHQEQGCVFTPIPLSHKRERERGYNQVEEILRHTADVTAIPLLKRSRHTTPQMNLSRNERAKNLRNAFVFINPKEQYDHKTVILLDDVVTTGATLEAARAVLEANLPQSSRIITFALAH